ncbi:hypothetical protein M8997_014005 [Phyllobacterium sp. 21LDTY02-6]|uniref:hypothetical protein n=1 Tax=unclassified Phyllobacterium TaxID=2638441 RepID=UPI00202275A8|nr:MULTISPECIES: hypothetical protein [unclassified Phyllobacterium]MCO4318305.1 hypothetical protein [Phyllobacterium sp. 21LDTY02-6]MCX8280300.1 hypothetical protein [Phyllobacterium sp. 0TCS1.6C]MCX8294139.1 hypothetical protein [Phyllobacterium sp. 0TCS1.6A]
MTGYEKLVEAVAQAIHASRSHGSQEWDSVPDFIRQTYRDYATAGLSVVYDVLSNPSSEMIDAANRARPAVTSRTIQAAIEASPLNPNHKA